METMYRTSQETIAITFFLLRWAIVAPAVNQNNIDRKIAKPVFDMKRVGSEKPNVNNSVTLPLNISAINKNIPAIMADSSPPSRGRLHCVNLFGVGDSIMWLSFCSFESIIAINEARFNLQKNGILKWVHEPD